MIRVADLHYIEMDLGEAAPELRPAIVAAVHSFNCRQANALGLDFAPGRVRVFGQADMLTSFMLTPRLQRLAAMVVSLSPVAKVPPTETAVCVQRHLQSMRNQPARQRRFERRNPGVQRKAKAPRSDLAIPMNSTSTQQAFLLNVVRRESAPVEAVAFNSYGLCLPGSSIPAF